MAIASYPTVIGHVHEPDSTRSRMETSHRFRSTPASFVRWRKAKLVAARCDGNDGKVRPRLFILFLGERLTHATWIPLILSLCHNLTASVFFAKPGNAFWCRM